MYEPQPQKVPSNCTGAPKFSSGPIGGSSMMTGQNQIKIKAHLFKLGKTSSSRFADQTVEHILQDFPDLEVT